MTVAEPKELPEPGSMASSALDKLLVAWQTTPADSESETPADFFARRLVARALNGARGEGLDAREVVTALGRRLTGVAGVLGKPPFAEADIEAFLETFDEEVPAPPTV